MTAAPRPCPGAKSPLNPSRPLALCVDCVRRMAGEGEPLKPGAEHTREKWICVFRIAAMPAGEG